MIFHTNSTLEQCNDSESFLTCTKEFAIHHKISKHDSTKLTFDLSNLAETKLPVCQSYYPLPALEYHLKKACSTSHEVHF